MAHVRVKERSEDILFSRGGDAEARQLSAELAAVLANQEKLVWRYLKLGITTKVFDYAGVAVNYLALAAPVFGIVGAGISGGGGDSKDKGAVAQWISNASFAILQLIFGGSQIIDAAKIISDSAGYTARVGELFESLQLLPSDRLQSHPEAREFMLQEPTWLMAPIPGGGGGRADGRIQGTADAGGDGRGGRSADETIAVRNSMQSPCCHVSAEGRLHAHAAMHPILQYSIHSVPPELRSLVAALLPQPRGGRGKVETRREAARVGEAWGVSVTVGDVGVEGVEIEEVKVEDVRVEKVRVEDVKIVVTFQCSDADVSRAMNRLLFNSRLFQQQLCEQEGSAALADASPADSATAAHADLSPAGAGAPTQADVSRAMNRLLFNFRLFQQQLCEHIWAAGHWADAVDPLTGYLMHAASRTSGRSSGRAASHSGGVTLENSQKQLCEHIWAAGHWADAVDPLTGYLMHAEAAAAAAAAAGGATQPATPAQPATPTAPASPSMPSCPLILHPSFGTHTYPASLLTTAPLPLLQSAIRHVAGSVIVGHSLVHQSYNCYPPTSKEPLTATMAAVRSLISSVRLTPAAAVPLKSSASSLVRDESRNLNLSVNLAASCSSTKGSRRVAPPSAAATTLAAAAAAPTAEDAPSVAASETKVTTPPRRRLKVGCHAAQGRRDEMEDHVVVLEDIGAGFLYAGVFDGHAGASSAKFLSDELHDDCMEALEGGAVLEDEDLTAAEDALRMLSLKPTNGCCSGAGGRRGVGGRGSDGRGRRARGRPETSAVVRGPGGVGWVVLGGLGVHDDCMEALEGGAVLEDALEDAFLKADQRLLQWLEEHSSEPESGSTGTVAFVRHDRLFVAHIGDSRSFPPSPSPPLAHTLPNCFPRLEEHSSEPESGSTGTVAFVRHDRLLEEHSSEPESGSTGTVAFVRHDRLFVAHIGDSRAVMASRPNPPSILPLPAYPCAAPQARGAQLEEHSSEPESGSTGTVAFVRHDRLFVAHIGDSRAVMARSHHMSPHPPLRRLEEHSSEPESGSTGTVAFVRHDRLFVAHIGDSRAVMAVGGDEGYISDDHKPSGDSSKAQAEIKRINKAGGWVSQGRVCGVIAVSRAFGNVAFKTRKEEMMQQGVKKGKWTTRWVSKRKYDSDWISALPDVYGTELTEDAEFVIIASDGLWDAFSSSEAVSFVRSEMQKHGDVQQACEALVHAALHDRGTEDNTSVIVISLRD
ncbi:unnamed protein product [Closterium sp. Yama58-4]|nr:unnamed protein product [Closterium sp. Yama58-4]